MGGGGGIHAGAAAHALILGVRAVGELDAAAKATGGQLGVGGVQDGCKRGCHTPMHLFEDPGGVAGIWLEIWAG